MEELILSQKETDAKYKETEKLVLTKNICGVNNSNGAFAEEFFITH